MTTDNAATPLVVDLDGTLIRSDLLLESFLQLASSAPWQAIKAAASLRRGRAALKAALAEHVTIEAATLPYNEPLLAWLKEQKAQGSALYLASAADTKYVQAVADHLGIFTGIFASDGAVNLKSRAKAEALSERFGSGKFAYIGNEKADIAVWQQAGAVGVTNASARFTRHVQQRFAGATVINTPRASERDYIRALRPHQWLKNMLIFVPAMAAHQFSIASLGGCMLAFAAFSLCASSGYVLNDLMDLRNDRQHHSKRHRPFASGRISLHAGIGLMLASLLAAFAIGSLLPMQFLLVLLLYYVLTVSYSTFIKRKMMLDVVVLALLYSVRLIAGGVALDIPLSPWLLSFSAFFFLSLALIKRCAELVARRNLGSGDPVGRDYRLSDLPMLESMSAAAGYVAALTSGLYISSAKVVELYSHSNGLWAIPVILLFWFSRILVLTHRGQMADDPVVFAARDRTSLLCGVAIVGVLFASI